MLGLGQTWGHMARMSSDWQGQHTPDSDALAFTGVPLEVGAGAGSVAGAGVLPCGAVALRVSTVRVEPAVVAPSGPASRAASAATWLPKRATSSGRARGPAAGRCIEVPATQI